MARPLPIKLASGLYHVASRRDRREAIYRATIRTERTGSRCFKTQGSADPVVIEIKYKKPGYPLITYQLAVDEYKGRWSWKSKRRARPSHQSLV